MTGRAWYEADKRYLDTSDPDDRQIVRGHVGKSAGLFRCEVNRGPLYAQVRGDTPTLSHYPRTAHGDCHYAFGMSAEHRRQQEYWAEAGRQAGFDSKLEATTGNGTRIDVVIEGPQLVGIEVQRSYLAVPAAKARTTKSFRAGYRTLWTSSAESRPKWADLIPTLRATSSFTDRMPRLGTATAVGPRRVIVERCEPGARAAGCRRPCGRRHRVAFQLIHGLTIDDVAAQFPAGDFVPLAYNDKANVYLVPPESMALFCEATGHDALWTPGGDPRRESVRRGALGQLGVECASASHEPHRATEGEVVDSLAVVSAAVRPPPPQPYVGWRKGECVYGCAGVMAHLYPSGWFCDWHKPGRRGRWR